MSDIRKLVQWYNILAKAGYKDYYVKAEVEVPAEEAPAHAEEAAPAAEAEKPAKKPAAKKPAAKKATTTKKPAEKKNDRQGYEESRQINALQAAQLLAHNKRPRPSFGHCRGRFLWGKPRKFPVF